jgi:hypothetical protein
MLSVVDHIFSKSQEVAGQEMKWMKACFRCADAGDGDVCFSAKNEVFCRITCGFRVLCGSVH